MVSGTGADETGGAGTKSSGPLLAGKGRSPGEEWFNSPEFGAFRFPSPEVPSDTLPINTTCRRLVLAVWSSRIAGTG
jgi:hypothetical protein